MRLLPVRPVLPDRTACTFPWPRAYIYNMAGDDNYEEMHFYHDSYCIYMWPGVLENTTVKSTPDSFTFSSQLSARSLTPDWLQIHHGEGPVLPRN